MDSNQIAELFSKGTETQYWLTEKQTSWILGVWQKENPKANTHFGRGYAGGSFRNDNGLFRWECHEGYHGSSLLKVFRVNEEEKEVHPLEAFITAKGYDFKKVISDEPELLKNLLEEFYQGRS